MNTNFALPPMSPDASFYLALEGFLASGFLVILLFYFNGLDLLRVILEILKENTPRR